MWLTILDFMDKFMHASGSELLMEAIPESLKNMLLVMETAGVFDPPSDGTVQDVSFSLLSVSCLYFSIFLSVLISLSFFPPHYTLIFLSKNHVYKNIQAQIAK